MSETPRNKVNILAHFEAAVAASDARLKQAKSTLKTLEKSVAANDDAHEAAVKAVKAEIEKTDKLIDTLAGEDATILATLRKKASDLQTKLKAIVSEYPNSEANVKIRESLSSARGALEEAQDELSKAEKQRDAAKQLSEASAQRALEKWNPKRAGVAEAEEFDTLEEAVNAYLLGTPVVVEISPGGKVIDKVHILHGLDDGHSTSDVFARPGVRYAVKVIPDDLHWLREADESGFQDVPNWYGHFTVKDVDFDTAPTEKEKASFGMAFSFGAAIEASVAHRNFFVCFIKSESKFYALSPKKFPSLELATPAHRGRDHYGRPCDFPAVFGEVEQDASSIFSSMAKHVLASVAQSQKEFGDIGNAKSAMAKRVHAAVSEVATTETLFFPQEKRLNAAQVNADVGAYWDAFLSAPWERSVQGGLKMLKHLCERKMETPNVWSNDFKGHYGMSVRTRDHSWIHVEIFCPPSALSPSQPISPDSVRYLKCGDRQQIAKIGPCYIMVDNGR